MDSRRVISMLTRLSNDSPDIIPASTQIINIHFSPQAALYTGTLRHNISNARSNSSLRRLLPSTDARRTLVKLMGVCLVGMTVHKMRQKHYFSIDAVTNLMGPPSFFCERNSDWLMVGRVVASWTIGASWIFS